MLSSTSSLISRLKNCATVQAIVTAGFLLIPPARGIELSDFEATAHGFPALRNLDGSPLADGEFVQWLANERLHVRIRYEFLDGKRVEENAVFRQKPELVQEEWSWEESKDRQVNRKFAVDLNSGKASAEKREGKELKRWTEDLKVKPRLTFAGFGFTLAIKALRERLSNGEKVELQAVGFTPKPRLVSVEISYHGLDQMSMAGRILKGERFVIHAKIPKIARLFVEVPDTRIWLNFPPPAGFLRWEGPFAEPEDRVIRVDLLPGGRSGPAEPVERSPPQQKEKGE